MENQTKYSSGYEDNLREKILNSADQSIDPLMLFEWSLELNHGRLFEAILTVHETLRREARYYNKFVQYPSNKEAMHQFFNKFIDVRGDLEERGDAFKGDHRGSWYRIWGSMLHYVKMVSPTNATGTSGGQACSSFKTKSEFMAYLRGSATATLAEKVKYLMPGWSEPDPRKSEINQKGYDCMNQFFEDLKKDHFPKDLEERCKKRFYLQNVQPEIDREAERALRDSRHPSHYEP